MPPQGYGLASLSPSINPYPTQDSPNTPADPTAHIPPNASVQNLGSGCHFYDFSCLQLPSPQIPFCEIDNFSTPADEPEHLRRFRAFKRAFLQDINRLKYLEAARGLLEAVEELHFKVKSMPSRNGELPNSKGVSIVRFTGPGKKPHQGGWKEKSMKGLRAVADPSPQPTGQQQQQHYVGLKKMLELDDDGNGNKWHALEYTPLFPSDDGTNKLIPAENSVRVEFQKDEPRSSSLKRTRNGGSKIQASEVWNHMTGVHDKVITTNKNGSMEEPHYKVMYAICNHCDQVFNADSKNGTSNQLRHLNGTSCKGKCNCTHSHSLHRSSFTFFCR